MSNALGALCAYGSDESDNEEIPSCDVSKKRSLSTKTEGSDNTQIKRMKLPVPDIKVPQIPLDDHGADCADEHQGRNRQFAHQRGNWVTYIYIPFDGGAAMLELQQNLIEIVPDLKVVDHLHLSLTKTVVLRHHWIDSFVKSVQELLSQAKFVPFCLCLGNLGIYTNDNATRTFIGLKILSGYDRLISAVDIFDKCLADFKLDPFYKDPSFHMSILWANGDKSKEFTQLLPQLQEKATMVMKNEQWIIQTDHFKCKCGNKIFNFVF